MENDLDDVVEELQAEPDASTPLQVNYFLLCLAPVILVLVKFFSKLSIWISQYFFLPSQDELKKLKEFEQIKAQLNSMSLQAEFAAFSKLQRKLNQITLNLEADALARKSLRNSLARTIRMILYAIVGSVYIFTLLWYGTKNPVLILPSDWYFPLDSILAFPTGVSGAISLPMWTLMSRTFISCVS